MDRAPIKTVPVKIYTLLETGRPQGDELFPEITQVFKNPNLSTALAIREQFSTPHEVATASMTALNDLRKRNYPSDKQLFRLQQLASQSIGAKDVVSRQRGLVFEQTQQLKN